jgi:tetratricopeptide (TPR) repeat protein
LFNKGIAIEEKLGINFLRGRLLNGIADAFMQQNKYSLALRHYQQALEISEKSTELTFRSRALTDMGDYYNKMGDFSLAKTYNEEALAIRKKMNIQGGAVTNMMNLAEIFHKTGLTNDGIKMLEDALIIAEEIRAKAKMYAIHKTLSDVYLNMDNLPKSMMHYKAFHEISQDVNHEDSERKVKNQLRLFEAEQTKKENATIKAQKVEIEHKNHQLEETIEELTITKISRRAKAITLFIAVALIVIEGVINHFVVLRYVHNNFALNLAAEGVIVLMLKPIEKAVEHYLLSNVIKKRKQAKEALEMELA